MKLTKEQLKQIIREELDAVLEVNPFTSSGKGLPRNRKRDRLRKMAAATRGRSSQPEKSEGWVLRRSGAEENEGKYYIGGSDYGIRDQARVFEFEAQAKHYADHIEKKEGYHLVPEEA